MFDSLTNKLACVGFLWLTFTTTIILSQECKDAHSSCYYWFLSNYCNDPVYANVMFESCKNTCGHCNQGRRTSSSNFAVCKDDPPRFISCPAQSTINIIDIVYGRKRNRCGVQWYKSCRSRTAETMTRNACQGKRYCMIYGYQDGYGNPCSSPGNDEYMDVTYECTGISVPTTENPIKKAYVCENMYTLVNCAGKGVVDVRSAFYGRKSRQHCATGDISNVQCSVDATNFAKHYCHGKTWCYAGANSASLGDPCPGISKYMEIVYECKAPSYFTTGPPSAPLFD